MMYRRKKSMLSSSQRTTFERQLFGFCLINEEFRQVVEKAYQDFSFIHEETQLPLAEFGQKYCEIVIRNETILYDFQRIPKLMGMRDSSYYVYRNDVVEKIYSMCLNANLI